MVRQRDGPTKLGYEAKWLGCFLSFVRFFVSPTWNQECNVHRVRSLISVDVAGDDKVDGVVEEKVLHVRLHLQCLPLLVVVGVRAVPASPAKHIPTGGGGEEGRRRRTERYMLNRHRRLSGARRRLQRSAVRLVQPFRGKETKKKYFRKTKRWEGARWE